MITEKDLNCFCEQHKITYSTLVKKSITRFSGCSFFNDVFDSVCNDVILEIGTYYGLSALFLSQIFKKVITIDVIAWDRWAERIIDYFKIDNIIRLVVAENQIHPLIKQLQFDFSFIDGDHISPKPLLDFQACKKCGSVLMHDYGRLSIDEVIETWSEDEYQIYPNDGFVYWNIK